MTELLAPAGDLISLKAAIASGADAVYLGLSAFNARIKAENFNYDNIGDTVNYCHLFGVKVYVTLNISIKDSEIAELERAVEACRNAKADALIVCDPAVLDIAHKIAPEMPLHASTQLGICNAEGAKYAEKLGFTRVVLSREVTLREIKEIKNSTRLEIECFIQGALCAAFSGKCLLSSITNGGSGNRGRCLQPCRLPYTETTTGESGYLLSTSDLCLAKRLKDLYDVGVSSFKIEGRLRRPAYVYDTVRTYREIIDNGFEVSENNLKTLKAAYNRGNFTEGYAFSDTKSIMSTEVQGNLGIRAGKITDIKKGYAVISGNYKFSIGEGYKLLNESGAEVGGGRIDKIVGGNPMLAGAKKGYFVHITSSSDFVFDEKKLKTDVSYLLDKNGIFSLKLSAGGASVSVNSAYAFEKAENRPLEKSVIESAIGRFGGEVFAPSGISGDIEGSFFAPRSELNGLRRSGLEMLKREILNSYKNQKNSAKYFDIIIQKGLNYNNLIAVELQNAGQLSKDLLSSADIIVYYPDIFSTGTAKAFIESVKSICGKEIFLKLTPNARSNDVMLFREMLSSCAFDGIYADNLYAVELAFEYRLKLFSGIGLNIFNHISAAYFGGDYYAVSTELNAREISCFALPFVYAYGRLPLMNLSHCVNKLLKNENCKTCSYEGRFVYNDRKNYKFDVIRNKAANCYFTLFNSKITDISAKFINNNFNYYLNMLQCDSAEAAAVAAAFKAGRPLGTAECTYGHMQRGVL